jgi:hypothetical protein
MSSHILRDFSVARHGLRSESRDGLRSYWLGDYQTALRHFDAALDSVLPGGVPLREYGLVSPSDTEAAELAAGARCSAARLTEILTWRAATEITLGLSLRALADTGYALALSGGRRAAVLRALALLSIGACAAAEQTLRPYTVQSREASVASSPSVLPTATRHAWYVRRQRLAVHLLHAAATVREQRVLSSVEALFAAPNASERVPRDYSYVHGALRVQSMGEGKGRGWVAMADVSAGTLLVVEPALFPTVPPQTDLDEESTLPLLRAVAHQARPPAHRTLRPSLLTVAGVPSLMCRR